jgi:hypothetical protein
MNYTDKHKNVKNGDIINGVVYNRTFDFNRDSWKALIIKIITWSFDDRSKHIPKMQYILKHRIAKGCCTKSEVREYLHKESYKIKELLKHRD